MGKARARSIQYASVLVLVVLLVTGCSDFMAEQGQILLTIELDNRGQEVSSYVISGTHADGKEFSIDNGTAVQAEVRSLAPGEWTITVVARDVAEVQIGEGTQVVQLSSGKKIEATVLVVFGQAPPSGLAGEEPARFDSAQGSIIGTTVQMEYRLKSAGADAYVACSGTRTAVAPGVYLVRFSARTGFEAGFGREVAVPAFQPIQLTITDPDLTTTKAYDGTAVATITAGTLVNVRPTETVTVSAEATYDTALAGTGKTISVVYTLGGADAGNYIKPVDGSDATGAITALPITAIGAISGTVMVGKELTAGTLTPSGATADYQWMICDTVGGSYADIAGATSSTYTLVVADEGKFLKVVATGTGNYSGTVTSAATTAVAEKVYVVKDIGPAGGLVFYDKGSVSDGWRYLEAAPASTEWVAKVWGGYGTEVAGTGTAIGDGEGNTTDIVAKYGSAEPYAAQTDYAAKLCNDLEVTENSVKYDDWFLPSEDELDLMYDNLKASTPSLGGLADSNYWSSSEYSSHAVWGQYFSNGNQYDYTKNNNLRVRAVRAF